MKKLIVFSLFALFVLPIGAHAKMDLFGSSDGKKIVSSACLMSYTDEFGMGFRVIKSNPVVILLK